jgi:hypothetical protein
MLHRPLDVELRSSILFSEEDRRKRDLANFYFTDYSIIFKYVDIITPTSYKRERT